MIRLPKCSNRRRKAYIFRNVSVERCPFGDFDLFAVVQNTANGTEHHEANGTAN